MNLKIKNNKTVDDVQKHFSAHYPYLKIVFFNKKHHAEEGSFNKHRYLHGTLIGDIRLKHVCDEIEITSSQTTAEVEQKFEKLFGLHVQVYRKAGMEWIQTIGTDNLTIDQQNTIGKKSNTKVMHPDDVVKIEETKRL